jgi:hypothetical protein
MRLKHFSRDPIRSRDKRIHRGLRGSSELHWNDLVAVAVDGGTKTSHIQGTEDSYTIDEAVCERNKSIQQPTEEILS